MNPLEYLTIHPDGYEESRTYPVIIWLHGFGADMHDLTGLAELVGPADYIHVLPNAPLGGFGGGDGTIRAWYERGSGTARKLHDPESAVKSYASKPPRAALAT